MQESMDNAVICRCEEITRGEILEAIRRGDNDLGTIKRRTRAGMGLCQGKNCARLIAGMIHEATGESISDIKTPSIRQPVNAVTLETVASGADLSIITDLSDIGVTEL